MCYGVRYDLGRPHGKPASFLRKHCGRPYNQIIKRGIDRYLGRFVKRPYGVDIILLFRQHSNARSLPILHFALCILPFSSRVALANSAFCILHSAFCIYFCLFCHIFTRKSYSSSINVQIIHKMFIFICYNILCVIARRCAYSRNLKERNS